MKPPGLRVEIRDGAHWWHLDQPARRNAVHPEALRWIAQRCASFDDEVVVLTGAGDTAFCSGFDLTALTPTAGGPPPDRPLAEATAAIEASNATFIAAINGFAVGAGLELACACDLRMARDDAWFAVPAARLGVVYHADGLDRLRAVLGPALLARLLLLGERLSAAELRGAGALTHVVPRNELDARVHDVIAALRAGVPLSVRAHRAYLRAAARGTFDDDARSSHVSARVEAYARIASTRVANRTDNE